MVGEGYAKRADSRGDVAAVSPCRSDHRPGLEGLASPCGFDTLRITRGTKPAVPVSAHAREIGIPRCNPSTHGVTVRIHEELLSDGVVFHTSAVYVADLDGSAIPAIRKAAGLLFGTGIFVGRPYLFFAVKAGLLSGSSHRRREFVS